MLQGGPPPHTKSRAVSFASAVSTIPTLSTDDVDIDDGVSPSSNLITLRPTVGGESEDLTTVSKDFLSVSTCDEVSPLIKKCTVWLHTTPTFVACTIMKGWSGLGCKTAVYM